MAPARREPTKAYEPAPVRPPSTSDRGWRGPPSTPDPAPAPAAVRPAAAPRKPVFRWARRLIRRLIAMLVVLATLAVLGLVGISALFNSTPDQVMNRVVLILDQVRGAGS
jgi:hypothetical protein